MLPNIDFAGELLAWMASMLPGIRPDSWAFTGETDGATGNMLSRMRSLIVSLAFLGCQGAFAAPDACDGVERGPQGEAGAEVTRTLARQLDATDVKIVQSYRSDIWNLLAIEADSERTYLVYAGDPVKTAFIASWAGASSGDSDKAVRAWVLRSAPSMPAKLADCFAWSVTKGAGA